MLKILKEFKGEKYDEKCMYLIDSKIDPRKLIQSKDGEEFWNSAQFDGAAINTTTILK